MWCLKIHRAAGTHEKLTRSTQTHTCLSHDGEFRVKKQQPLRFRSAKTGAAVKGRGSKIAGLSQSETQQVTKGF